jgi:hypothetical protein
LAARTAANCSQSERTWLTCRLRILLYLNHVQETD